jgi:hypothetical protein
LGEPMSRTVDKSSVSLSKLPCAVSNTRLLLLSNPKC